MMIGETGAARWGPMRRLSALSRAQVIYLLVVPLALIAFNASARWSINYDLTLSQVLAISLALNAVPWWGLLLVMWPVHRLLGPFKLPLWGLTTIATLLTGILLHGYLKFCFAQIGFFAPSFLQAKATAQFGFTLPYLLLFIKCALPTVLTTTVCIQVCENFLGLGWWQQRLAASPRSTLFEDADASHSVAPPLDFMAPAKTAMSARASFLRHSKLPETAIVLALEAEDHYLRIYAESGSDLIRYRFTDALTELGHTYGLRVHRSWWVNSECALHFTATGKVAEITLTNGLRVPGSLRYRSAVERELGAPKGRAPSKTFSLGERGVSERK
jgi:hypothetical protein